MNEYPKTIHKSFITITFDNKEQEENYYNLVKSSCSSNSNEEEKNIKNEEPVAITRTRKRK